MLVGEVFARMGLDSKQYEKDLDRLENETKKRALTLGNIFKGALSVTIGMTMFEAVKRGFQTVVGESISFNAQMEQARIGFTTMLGSAERAQVFLDDMAKFAAKTPFEFPELLDASKRMLAYGFAAEDVLPTMEAVGNASAAVGLGTEGINRIILALGQMRAKGKLSGEEMRQLTETGIPAWEILAEAMNKTTAEIMDMQQKGLIPADRAIKMLVDGMNKRFPNMMAQMENTWEGVTSTIKDVWQMTIGAVTQNLFQGVVSWLQKVRDFAVGFYDTFQRYGLQRAISESFGPEVAAIVSVLGATLRGLASVVSAVTSFITKYGKQIRFAAVVMGTYLVLLKTVTLAKWLATVATTALTNSQLLLAGQSSATTGIIRFLSNVITFYKIQMLGASSTTNAFTGALFRLRAALYAVWTALGPVGWAILGISLAVAGGMSLWNKYSQSVYSGAKVHDELAKVTDQVEGSVGGATGAIEDETDALKKAGKAAGKNLQSFDEVHQLQEDMAGSAEDLAKSMGLDDTEFGVPDAGGFGIPDIGAQLEEMKPTLAGFWEWIKQGAGNLWEGIKEKWNGFKEWVSSWGIWTTLKEKWSGFKEWAGNLWEGIKEKWSGFWEWVKSWGLWQWLADRWDGLKEWAGNVWEGAKERWEGFKSWVASWAGPLWDGIKEKWAGFKEWAANMWDGAKEKWGNFTDWVQEKWSSFKTKAGEIWTDIKTNVQTKWEELKTNAPIIWEDIKTSIQTRWENLKTSAGETWNNITTRIKEKWNNLKTNAPTVWENIKDEISQRWEELKVNAPTTWENIKKEISNRWEALKTNAPIAWNNISKTIKDSWENLKTNVPATWNDIKKAIADKWREIKEDALSWGKNLISGFVQGVKDKIASIKSTLKNVGNTIKNFLGFSSPTKEGPGRDADKWAPNLMQMYADGITAGIPKVRSAVNVAASELTGLTAMPSVPSIPTATAGIAGSADAIPEIGEIGIGAIPDIGAQLEQIQPTLAGFWEWIKQGAGNLWESVKQKWSDFVNWVKSWAVWDWLAQKWSGLKNIASAAWNGVANVISSAWAGIANITQTVWQGVWKLLQTSWNNAVKLATDVFGAIRDYVVGTWENIEKTASDIWGAIWGLLKNQWETIKTFAINIFGTVRDLILGKIDLRTAVKQIWGEINNFFFSSWSNIRDFGINIWTALRDFFLNQWLLIQGFAIAIWTAIKDFLTSNWEATKEAASNIWNAIKTFFSNTWEAIKTAAANIWTAIRDFLGINWEETKKRASEIWSNIKTIITDKWNELKNAVGPTWNRIKTAIADKWREIKDDAFNWGKNLINSFVEGIKNKINSVKSTLKSVGQSVKNFIGFSSPTKEGPGRFADEWAPNLMNMFAEGLNQNIPKVRSAVDEVVQQLTGMTVQPTVQPTVQQSVVPATTTTGDSGLADTVAQAVYRAVIDAIRVVQASSQQSDDRELVLKIDNTVLARMQLPAIIREGQRQGLNLVVRPQGV